MPGVDPWGYEVCAFTLFCDAASGTCQHPGEVGEPCIEHAVFDCRLGARCENGVCRSAAGALVSARCE
jgi:hypothetical protein